MALSARPIRYIVSGLPTSNSATAGRRPLTPRTTIQVRLYKQLLDKRTGALLVLPQHHLLCLLEFLQKFFESIVGISYAAFHATLECGIAVGN